MSNVEQGGNNNFGLSTSDNQTNGTQKTQVVDTTGTTWMLESNGAMPVNIQDQTSDSYTLFLRQTYNTVTLASNTIIDSYTVTLVAGHNFVAGNTFLVKEGVNYFQAQCLSVATNVITLDCPLDFVFTTNALAERCNINMNVDGSVTPQIFYSSPAGLTTGFKIDVTKVHFHLQDNVKMDMSTFGGLPELTRGIVLRQKDGKYKNYMNVKKNGDFGHHCDDISLIAGATGKGEYDFTAIKRFAGQANQGVTVRLSASSSDALQVIIQDNLTALTEFHCIAHGHVVTN
jgi:hypothetical protein